MFHTHTDACTCQAKGDAGVICESDPYQELELYLEKVNREIGEVFNQWSITSEAKSVSSSAEPLKWKIERNESNVTTTLHKYSDKLNLDVECWKNAQSLNSGASLLIGREIAADANFEKYLEGWSESLLAEFNTIIQDKHGATSHSYDVIQSAHVGLGVDADGDTDDADEDYNENATDLSDEQENRLSSSVINVRYSVEKCRHRHNRLHHDPYHHHHRRCGRHRRHRHRRHRRPRHPALSSSSSSSSSLYTFPLSSGRRGDIIDGGILTVVDDGVNCRYNTDDGSSSSLPSICSELSCVIRQKKPHSQVAITRGEHDSVWTPTSEGAAAAAAHFPTFNHNRTFDNADRACSRTHADCCCANQPESREQFVTETVTETSPEYSYSRSSSFTWISEDDYSSITSSATEESRRFGDSSCSDSMCTTPQLKDEPEPEPEPESGIGTASPPHYYRLYKNPCTLQKCRYKQFLEKLRKKPSRPNLAEVLSPSNTFEKSSLVFESSSGQDLATFTNKGTQQPRPTCSMFSAAANSASGSASTSTSASRTGIVTANAPSWLSVDSSRQTLPSPSTMSLKLRAGRKSLELTLLCELGSKSRSVPLLLKDTNVENVSSLSSSSSSLSAVAAMKAAEKKINQPPSSYSEKTLVEIEANEACKWLRAAGFPQYAQMYEDLQFPIDVDSVQRDHQFLEADALRSLFRRLQALNKCANMNVEFSRINQDESDSEMERALSENWLFQPESGRWSRICDRRRGGFTAPFAVDICDSTTDSGDAKQNDDNVDAILKGSNQFVGASDVATMSRFRRSGSERLRDGAKALLKRVESLKSKRRKQRNCDGVVISGPRIVDAPSMEAKIKELNCVDVGPSQISTPSIENAAARYLSNSCSDSDSQVPKGQRQRQRVYEKSVAECNAEMRLPLDAESNVSSEPSRHPLIKRNSQDNQIFKREIENLYRLSNNVHDVDHCKGASSGNATFSQKTTVVRWHSFQRNSSKANWSSLRGKSINSLTVGQILVLRKLSLLKLTAIMEKYYPSHRTVGWNWELPKFIRSKVKTPADITFKAADRTVFGMPLLANVQQNGNVFPRFIVAALDWLRTNALNQVGIFRKSGGRSRIHKLIAMAESEPVTEINFDHQQPHDVADMLKQYFRELPDALLTNKLSDTFITVFQYVPENLRRDAVRWIIILLPDEHREALLILLDFLYQVAQHSYENQMSARNLAICLAPSLFFWTHATSNNTYMRQTSCVSPKRFLKNNSFPDVNELGRNIAAHECLNFMITNYRDLFVVTDEIMSQCCFNYMDHSVPISLEELGEELQQDWRGYLKMCRVALLKEIKERNRGWMVYANWEDVEIAYKKVADGHPLRLWRVCTEVEAPPKELLFRVLRERHLWDGNLLTSKIVKKLEPFAELFQYVTRNIGPLPTKDFCVIRSWRTNLPKGGCMVVETSVEHNDAKVLADGVRGIVLASRYLIEPCGSGKSRILHLSRVDIKGRSVEWYNKCYGHICAQYLSKIRDSFQRTTEGPESKV